MSSPEDELREHLDQTDGEMARAEILSQTAVDLLYHASDLSMSRPLGETAMLGHVPWRPIEGLITGNLETEPGSPAFDITLLPTHENLAISLLEENDKRTARFSINQFKIDPLLYIARGENEGLSVEQLNLILGSANRQTIARVFQAYGSI